MSGHLFLVRGDVTRLHCDAFAVPTDRFGSIGESFLAHGPPSWRKGRSKLNNNALERMAADGAVAADGWDGCHFLDIGRNDVAPIGVFVKALRCFFRLAVRQVPRTSRERPLFAIPLMGARHGGAAKERAVHVQRLLALVEQTMAEANADFDVVVVAWSRELFAWSQAVRRSRMTTTFSELPRRLGPPVSRLGRLAAEGRLVLFVGAGVSAGVGLPTWDGLLRALEDEHLTKAQRKSARTLDVLDRAAVVASKLDGETVGQAVAKHFSGARTPGLQHALLASLPVTEIVTTNYDQLLEAAADAAQDPVTVIPYRNAQSARRWLLKLHGDVEQTEGIVLTRDDYLSYPEQRGALRGIVQALLLTRHMLFVGFSMNDDNFARIAHDVRRVTALADLAEDVELGTVLSLFQDEARKLIWGEDLQTLHMAKPLKDDGPDGPAAARDKRIAEAARLHEIFLDRLVLEASPDSLHVLDPTFDGVLTPADRKAKEALEDLATAASKFPAETSPAWGQIHALLHGLGRSVS